MAGLRRFGAAAAQADGIGHVVTDHHTKHIIRQWDREIEDEIRRREAALNRADGPWRSVVWGALWLLWLGLLIALLSHTKAFG
jgi:hypothetical protein